MKISKNIIQLIGNTPLLELGNYNRQNFLLAKIVAKLEYYNPAGSIKDRIASLMISDAEEKGVLNQNSVIIEPTSGNTGIGLAAICAAKGYKLILTMPETMSAERRSLIKAYGAEIVLTDGAKGMKGAIEKAEEIAGKTDNSFLPCQFKNPANPLAHKLSTGPEIWHDTNGLVDIVVCGVGTGGTISGVGEYLKQKNPNIKIIAVEPLDSPVLTKGANAAGVHKLQGIGAGFVPDTLNTNIYDEVITVSNDNAFAAAKKIAKTDGVLIGISSGAALWAATEAALREENKNKLIVVIMPDTGERYLSSLFNE